jgi:hypothetical protein
MLKPTISAIATQYFFHKWLRSKSEINQPIFFKLKKARRRSFPYHDSAVWLFLSHSVTALKSKVNGNLKPGGIESESVHT